MPSPKNPPLSKKKKTSKARTSSKKTTSVKKASPQRKKTSTKTGTKGTVKKTSGKKPVSATSSKKRTGTSSSSKRPSSASSPQKRTATPKVKKAKSPPSKRKHPPKKSHSRKKKSSRSFFSSKLFLLLLWSGLAGGVLLLLFWITLPSLQDPKATTRPASITLLSQSGDILAQRGAVHGKTLYLEELPFYVPNSFIAIEDRRFFEHDGVDPRGLGRAALSNLKTQSVQGGSTITQQVVKNLFLTPKRSLIRKIREALLALKLERKLTKAEILEIYLNRIYFGAGYYGLEAASEGYFNKNASQLSLYESALLAGMVKGPNLYSPVRNPALAHKRASLVLSSLVDQGWILDQDKNNALQDGPPQISGSSLKKNEGYFVDWVLQEVSLLIPYPREDLIIQTTLDPAVQTVLFEEFSRSSLPKTLQMASLILGYDGRVLGMMGGRSYRQSQFNRVTQSKRSPASTFKLFTYLTAFEKGWKSTDKLSSGPLTLEGWSPRNSHLSLKNKITLKEAFAYSVNTSTIALQEKVGRGAVISTAQKLGIYSPLEKRASLSLGSQGVSLLEMTGAYATVNAQGVQAFPYGIKNIRNQNGKLLYTLNSKKKTLLSKKQTNSMRDLLLSVVSFGTAKNAAFFGTEVKGKTGTSQNNRDALFIGSAGRLTGAIWMGQDNNKPVKGLGGGQQAAPLWRQIMSRLSH